MTEADDGVWWLAGDGQWHEGSPPAGWVQAGDRRWYPDEPPETAKGYANKFESAGGRTATVLALVRRTDVAAPAGAGDGAVGDAYDSDDAAWLPDNANDPADPADTYDPDDTYDPYDTYDPGGADDIDGERRRRPAWVLVTVLAALLLAVVAVVGLAAGTDGGSDGETGPIVDTAPGSSALPSSTTPVTTAIPATTVDAGPLGPSVTVAPPVTEPPTTIPRERVPSTTIPPDTTPGPPATGPNPGVPPGQATIREGGRCFNVGETAVAANGTPVTCATTACDGDRYDDPRWRRTTC